MTINCQKMTDDVLTVIRDTTYESLFSTGIEKEKSIKTTETRYFQQQFLQTCNY